MAVDFSTDIGKVRALTGDVNELKYVLQDIEVSTILDTMGGVILLTAASCLEVMASKFALVSQKIRTLDITTDGPAVARVLLDRAKVLREQHETSTEDGLSEFEVFPVIARADYWYTPEDMYAYHSYVGDVVRGSGL
jgi:hypothetical protein